MKSKSKFTGCQVSDLAIAYEESFTIMLRTSNRMMQRELIFDGQVFLAWY